VAIGYGKKPEALGQQPYVPNCISQLPHGVCVL
jgi:hypothetical protein